MKEIWKDIPGVSGYQASSLGRIRSVRVLVDVVEKRTGYHRVSVHRDEGVRKNRKAFVHVLVAAAFNGPKPEGKQVDHYDANRSNNKPDNLKYKFSKENIRHSFEIGNRNRYFTNEQMDDISDWFNTDGLSMTDIARKLTPTGSDQKKFKAIRARVRSVITIWRGGTGKTNPINIEVATKMRSMHSIGISTRDIAAKFNCSGTSVWNVVSGKTWTSDRDMRGSKSKGNPNFGKFVNGINRTPLTPV